RRTIERRANRAARKSEGRNPKLEGRPKSEIPNPTLRSWMDAMAADSVFGFRASDFFRISSFGFRACTGLEVTTRQLHAPAPPPSLPCPCAGCPGLRRGKQP